MRKNFFRSITTLAVLTSMTFSVLAQSSGFDTSRMDKSVDACEDFFEYANGSWLKTTQIPPTESRWGTFNILGVIEMF